MDKAGFRPDSQSIEHLVLALSESLCGWTRVKSSKGKVYYQRMCGDTNETSWKLPKGERRVDECMALLEALEEGRFEGGGASAAAYHAVMKVFIVCTAICMTREG